MQAIKDVLWADIVEIKDDAYLIALIVESRVC